MCRPQVHLLPLLIAVPVGATLLPYPLALMLAAMDAGCWRQ
jgi:hypothetical protein